MEKQTYNFNRDVRVGSENYTEPLNSGTPMGVSEIDDNLVKQGTADASNSANNGNCIANSINNFIAIP